MAIGFSRKSLDYYSALQNHPCEVIWIAKRSRTPQKSVHLIGTTLFSIIIKYGKKVDIEHLIYNYYEFANNDNFCR